MSVGEHGSFGIPMRGGRRARRLLGDAHQAASRRRSRRGRSATASLPLLALPLPARRWRPVVPARRQSLPALSLPALPCRAAVWHRGAPAPSSLARLRPAGPTVPRDEHQLRGSTAVASTSVAATTTRRRRVRPARARRTARPTPARPRRAAAPWSDRPARRRRFVAARRSRACATSSRNRRAPCRGSAPPATRAGRRGTAPPSAAPASPATSPAAAAARTSPARLAARAPSTSASRGCALEPAHDDALEILGIARPPRRRQRHRRLERPLHREKIGRRVVVRPRARGQLVEHDRQRIQIGAPIERTGRASARARCS